MTQRKTYNRMADIPPGLQRAFDHARENPITLAEWLAVDHAKLLQVILPEVGMRGAVPVLREVCKKRPRTLERMRAIGCALHEALAKHPDRQGAFDALASHRATMAREWAAMALCADPELPLAARIEATRRFAADESPNVRETAWMSLRPHIATDVQQAIALLRHWVLDTDPNVRRCAVEATRPRGVWCAHLPALKESPEQGLPLLEPLRADASRYVQTSVSNWINDASKSRPAWVESVCQRWDSESPTPETRWIIKRALRTLLKGTAASKG